MITAVIILHSGVLALVFLWALFIRLEKFREDLDYINMELERCSVPSRRHWKREKRRLWLWLLFFIPR